jgi:predicted RNA polymerase sigma factor
MRSLFARCQAFQRSKAVPTPSRHSRCTRSIPAAEDTDWPQIHGLYDLLDQMTANPVVTLNRAIATAMVSGPVDGLALLAALDQQLAGHHRLEATRAYLLEMAGDSRSSTVANARKSTSRPQASLRMGG